MAGGISTIIDAVARALWVNHWACEHERKKGDDPQHKLPWKIDTDLMVAAPETPWQAYVDAGRLVGAVEGANERQLEDALARGLKLQGRDAATLPETAARLLKEGFGHCLAREALGVPLYSMWERASGVDHTQKLFFSRVLQGLKIVVPSQWPAYMPEVFSGVHCDSCMRDAGPGWENCSDCKLPTCSECMAPPKDHLCQECASNREDRA
jgi:hypothetical protein